MTNTLARDAIYTIYFVLKKNCLQLCLLRLTEMFYKIKILRISIKTLPILYSFIKRKFIRTKKLIKMYSNAIPPRNSYSN